MDHRSASYSGKTRAIGTLAAYLAACVDYRAVLGPGERGTLPIMAASTLQAGQAYNFIRGVFTHVDRLAALVDNITADTISLKNRIDVQIRPASFRTIRGITAIAAIAEECSFWQADDSRNPDKEILAAIRPAMATTGGTLFAIGSPHARKGETWLTFRKHFGPEGNPAILVANGPTRTFNPTVKQSIIDRAYEDDASVAASEWGGQFRSDLKSYVSPEVVDACTARGTFQIPLIPGTPYVAHVDASGGSQDSFAMAIGHEEGGTAIVDFVFERRPPFAPEGVIAEVADILRSYGLHEITGDRYAIGFVSESFRRHGIEYCPAELTTSDFFIGLLPILNSRRVQLLDHKRLATQLCSLERRTSRIGSKDAVGHPIGGHDDIAAAVAGLACRLIGERSAPGLLRYENLLSDGGDLAEPINRDGPIFAILCSDKTGAVATVYGARYVNYPGRKPPLTILDFEVGWLSADIFLHTSERLKDFHSSLKLSQSAQLAEIYGADTTPVLYCSKAIAEQSRISASWYAVYPLPDLDIDQIKPTAAARVNAGHVKLTRAAVERSLHNPLGGALNFQSSLEEGENALRLAVTWAIYASFESRGALLPS